LNIGVITASFHSLGRSCKSIKDRNKTDNGNVIDDIVCLKKTAGRPSGPGPVDDFNLRIIL
jgi:hypothetical protein